MKKKEIKSAVKASITSGNYLNAFSFRDKFAHPEELPNFHKIQYEEIIKYVQENYNVLTDKLVSLYLEMWEKTGKSQESDINEERQRAKKMSPQITFELAKKKINYLKDQLREKLETKLREIDKNSYGISIRPEEPLEKYVKQLKEKNIKLTTQTAQEKEKIESLNEFSMKEHDSRVLIASKYCQEIEALKAEYATLQKLLGEKELVLLNFEAEKREADQLFIDYKLQEKLVDQMKEDFNTMEHKFKTIIANMQAEHLKVFFNGMLYFL